MSRLVAAARARSRLGGESGYALIVVMTAIAVFSIVVVALLSMLLTDFKVQALATSADTIRRAVDGALDTAVNQVKTDPTGNMGRLDQACNPVGNSGNGYSVTIEGVSVEIVCDPQQPDGSNAPLPSNTGTAVTATGGYTTPLNALAAYTAGGPLGAMIAGAAAQLANQIAGHSFGLIHFGSDPLRVDGDLNVKQYTFGYKSDFSGASPIAGPALQVSGAFHQGFCGLFGCVTVNVFGTNYNLTPNCGVLDSAFPGSDLGTHLTAGPGGLTCNMGSVPLFAPHMASPVTDVSTLPAVTLPAACPKDAHGVVPLTPGRYDLLQTLILNQWFVVGGCDNATFWFQPGDYYFDAAGGSPADRSALVLDNPTDKWVFGKPAAGVWDPTAGGAPTVADPPACDTTGGGVSITLSGRTTIRHKRGLAWLCGQKNPDGTQRTLVFQQDLPSQVTWAGEPKTAVDASDPATTPFATAGDAAAGQNLTPAAAGYPSTNLVGDAYDPGDGPTAKSASVFCKIGCYPTLRLTGLGNSLSPALKGDTAGLRLFIKTTASSNITGSATTLLCPNGCSYMVVKIKKADGTLLCSMRTPDDVPRGFTSIDLSACKNPAASGWFGVGVADATDLDGASVELTPILGEANCNFYIFGFYAACSGMTYTVDYAWLQTTINAPVPPASMATLVDATAGNSINYFGPVSVPRSDVEVNWQGGASASPIFAGGVEAKGIASWPSKAGVTVGILASPSTQPSNRTVLLRARIGGRLRGSALVKVKDATTDAGGQIKADPGNQLQVVDYRICNAAWPTSGSARPCGSP